MVQDSEMYDRKLFTHLDPLLDSPPPVSRTFIAYKSWAKDWKEVIFNVDKKTQIMQKSTKNLVSVCKLSFWNKLIEKFYAICL